MGLAYSFFDESGKFKDHTVVSFGGVAGGWRSSNHLSEEWAGLLRRYDLRSFSMKQVLKHNVALSDRLPRQTPSERADALMPFVTCIKDHAEVALITTMDVKAFAAIPDKARRALGNTKNPHYMAFLTSLFYVLRFVGDGDQLGIICDEDEETAIPCYQLYKQVKKARPDLKAKLASITFADDERFHQVQAADMLASLGRLESRKRFFGEEYDYAGLYEHLQAPGKQDGVRLEVRFWGKDDISQLGASFASVP